MRSINVHEAKTHFSRFLAEVERGGEFTIARAGKPVAKLVPIEPLARTGTRLGGLEGQGYSWQEETWTDADQQNLEALFHDEPVDLADT